MLVNARDLRHQEWAIPARAVWSDVDVDGRVQHPWKIGLAHGDSSHMAMLAGLSDRLGWEASVARRHGSQLPVVEGIGTGHTDDTVVYDGRGARCPDRACRLRPGDVLGCGSDIGRVPPCAVQRPW